MAIQNEVDRLIDRQGVSPVASGTDSGVALAEPWAKVSDAVASSGVVQQVPVDPYLAAAGYNLLFEVPMRRVLAYVRQSFPSGGASGLVLKALVAALQSASSIKFTSTWLSDVQGGELPSLADTVIGTQYTLAGISPLGDGRLEFGVSIWFFVAEVHLEGLKPYQKLVSTALGDFGPFYLLVRAPLAAVVDASSAVARVQVDFEKAEMVDSSLASSPDIVWLLGQTVGQQMRDTVVSTLRGASPLTLLPPVSPFGQAGGAGNAFDFVAADAFATPNPGWGSRGLSVGFRLRQGSVASSKDVWTIAGKHDYGVVMDEWTLGRVLGYRWKHNGFLHELPFTGPGKIDTKDGPLDVTIWGRLELDSLSGAKIRSDPNAKRSVIDLTGGARLIVDRVKTWKDGSEQVLQKDNEFAVDWSLAAGLETGPVKLPPNLAPFLNYASTHSIQHLASPLINVTQTVQEATLDSVGGYVYATGKF